MTTAIQWFFTILLDLLAPARGSQRLVRSLRVNDLHELAQGEEALPYRAREVTALVWEINYRRNLQAAALAAEFLAQELLAVAAEEIGQPLLIPVPMHASRKKERGYNQTELLCETAVKAFFDSTSVFDYGPDVLVRVRHTPPQQGLPKHQRLKNVKNSMQVVDPERTRGRVCIVVDDVTTTGATLLECPRAQSGARWRCTASPGVRSRPSCSPNNRATAK